MQKTFSQKINRQNKQKRKLLKKQKREQRMFQREMKESMRALMMIQAIHQEAAPKATKVMNTSTRNEVITRTSLFIY